MSKCFLFSKRKTSLSRWGNVIVIFIVFQIYFLLANMPGGLSIWNLIYQCKATFFLSDVSVLSIDEPAWPRLIVTSTWWKCFKNLNILIENFWEYLAYQIFRVWIKRGYLFKAYCDNSRLPKYVKLHNLKTTFFPLWLKISKYKHFWHILGPIRHLNSNEQ